MSISKFRESLGSQNELYLKALVSSCKEASVEWEEVKMLLRLKFDNSGTVVSFYSGGKSHHGPSLKNMTKLYRHALVHGDPFKRVSTSS